MTQERTNRISVRQVSAQADLQQAFAIRYEVFVTGQNCPAALEEEGNDTAVHFLALLNDIPAGAGRYRKTDKGYKLERIAVLEKFRGLGVGDALVKAFLEHLSGSGTIYLHSQLAAAGLYTRNGFEKEGALFIEADMEHIKMVYPKAATNKG